MHITAKVAAVAPSNQIGHPIKILNTPYVATADIDAANGLIIGSITTSPTPFGQFLLPGAGFIGIRYSDARFSPAQRKRSAPEVKRNAESADITRLCPIDGTPSP